jgi:hypothetical protein
MRDILDKPESAVKLFYTPASHQLNVCGHSGETRMVWAVGLSGRPNRPQSCLCLRHALLTLIFPEPWAWLYHWKAVKPGCFTTVCFGQARTKTMWPLFWRMSWGMRSHTCSRGSSATRRVES